MEKEIVKSSESEVKLSLKDGKLVVAASNHGSLGGGDVSLYVSTDALIDLICAKIPGSIDDAVGAVIKQALRLA